MAKLTGQDRARLLAVLEVLRHHAAQLDYPPGDVRGRQDAETWALSWKTAQRVLASGGRLQFDCSQAAQQAFRWADLLDPCGLDYRYAGDTGAMLRTLPHYTDPHAAWVGALVVYGPGRGDHVSVVITRGADPLLWSHGRSGLDVWRLSTQRSFHRPPVTFCSVAGLGR